MFRRIAALVVVVSLAGFIASPVEAKKKPKAGPVTYHMNWFGDCAGGGYLSLESVPNPDDCALFFPGLGDTHSFSGRAGLPLKLDASKKISVEFVLTHIAQAAADFEVVLTGSVDGDIKEIASGVQTVLAAGIGETPLYYELEPDPALDKAVFESLTLTVNWTNGVTYSSIDLQSGTATMVFPAAK